MAEVDKPHQALSSKKKEAGHLPQGSFLKPSISVPAKFFKPSGKSSSLFPQKVNSNLSEISDGPFKQARPHSFSDKELELKEQQARELTILLSHMSWLVDLLKLLSEKLPERPIEVTPLFSQVASHMKSIQAILIDRSVTNLANTVLLRRDAVISTISNPIPRELLNKFRSFPLLDELMFSLDMEDVQIMRERKKDRLFYQALKSSRPQTSQDSKQQQQPFRGKWPQRGSKSFSQNRQQNVSQSSSSQPKSKPDSGTQIQQSQVASQSSFKNRGRGRGRGKQSK